MITATSQVRSTRCPRLRRRVWTGYMITATAGSEQYLDGASTQPTDSHVFDVCGGDVLWWVGVAGYVPL